MLDLSKEFLGLFSAGLAFVSYTPYFYSALYGRNKPHVFSWLIWSMTDVIAFAAQISGQAGPGAWAMGVSAMFSILIFLVSLRFGMSQVRTIDICFFVAALLAIPLWIVTESPTVSVILISGIDVVAHGITTRKAWARHYEEMAFTHAISVAKHPIALLAMDRYTIATSLYPAVLFFVNAILVFVILLRRGMLKEPTQSSPSIPPVSTGSP